MSIRTAVCFDSKLLGYLLEDEDYVALGGLKLANAFANHHVQLARRQNGQLEIVDDLNSQAYQIIAGVCIVNRGTNGGWIFDDEQSAKTLAELDDACAVA